MRISIIKKDKIDNQLLPIKVYGSFWLNDKDLNGNDEKIIVINAVENQWLIKSDAEITIFKNKEAVTETFLSSYEFYELKLKSGETVLIYCSPINDPSYFQLTLKSEGEITIGSNEDNNIIFNSPLLSPNHCKLVYKAKKWSLVDLKSETSVYVNNEMTRAKDLNYGDIVFVMGLKIIVLLDNLFINNPKNNLKLRSNLFEIKKYSPQILKENKIEEDTDAEVYKKDDFYYKSPRFRGNVEKVQIVIDPPPAKENLQEMPLIYVVGPALTMGMTSAVTAFTSINSVISQGKAFSAAIPSLLIASSMLLTMIMWPMLSKKMEKKQKLAREKKRQELYSKYVDEKHQEIKTTISIQRQILNEKFQNLLEVKNILMNKQKSLWEREIFHDDFLDVRFGIGEVAAEIDIQVPEEKFSLETDELKESLTAIKNNYKNIPDAPVHFSFLKKSISAIIGNTDTIQKFFDGILLQLMTFHSYDDLKVVVLTDNSNKRWEYLKTLPHCWNSDKSMRFYGTNLDDSKQISSYLENIIQQRESSNKEREIGKTESPYFVVFTDNIKKYRDLEIIKSILNNNTNVGFSLIILNNRLANVPNECINFISIGDDLKSGIFENDLTSEKQVQFIADISEDLQLKECCEILAGTPIEVTRGAETLPTTYGFLEMYNIGKIEQLNIKNRWETNFPFMSLQAPIGTDEFGNLVKLDLHEKFHGPHGLIAGMTGSGKSELIVTYILSMAVNFHPDEVTFILIDYKGGGIAGAFENRELGIKLPHIVGTITNLDTIEMKRSLASIQSEIRRRQELFKIEKSKLNESTIDIYKYQRLYREGFIKAPISHLFIVCDEFAELKSQQPDFMDELISAARIGRSLGIHLVLSTQKPSGVVDDQIWSNSRFRICLKVQEQSDSNDMIKRPEAAYLKEVGRFYLQVGYNEMFTLGQSAWCGEKYIPVEKLKKKIDPYISFINNIGGVVKNIKEEQNDLSLKNYGEVLPNIINYIIDVADKEKIKTKQLWLNRIPNIIFIDNLRQKYFYKKVAGLINPIIGEYDDPDNQKQGLLTLNLTDGGNVIIYGSNGSGKSLLLTDIIYSSIIDYSATEVNFYVMDFGAETLNIFKDAPQVGDVIFLHEEEKALNLLKKLFRAIEERKKIFSKYSGNFVSFNRNSEVKLPLIVVIINNFEVFSETYEQLEDMFSVLTREGPKYGVVFIVTVAGVNSLRYKLKQNFKQNLTLELNDNSDYNSIFGNVHGKFPSKAVGRGLVKFKEIHEFQTAFPYEPDAVSEYIKIICQKLKNKASINAQQVSVLPDKVMRESIMAFQEGISKLPLGIEKDSLEVSTWDFEKNYGTLITADDEAPIINYIPPFSNQFSNINNVVTVVIDAKKLFTKENFASDIIYFDSNFNGFIDNLNTNVEKMDEIYKASKYDLNSLKNIKHFVCIILDIDYLFRKLDNTYIEKIKTIFKKGQLFGKISYILVNTVENVKKMEYDEWYKELIRDDEGIWLGSGIGNQFSLKLSKSSQEYNKKISNDFGYVVKRGTPVLVKLLVDSKNTLGGPDE